MESFVKKYKSDLIAIGVICAVILLFFGVSYLKWLHPIEDCGREFYVPLQILEGRILYKDIYSFYGPFAPYVLALLFKIFGATLTTGYYIGFFINFLLCGVVYYLSRLLLSAYKSCLVTLSFVIVVVFIPSLGGYQGTIVPYSYNALFGMFFILFQIAFLSKSFINKERSSNILLLSALFASLSITCKQDYALSSILITLFYSLYLLYNRYNVVNLLKYWFVTLILPVGAYGFFLLYVPFNIYLNKSLLPIKIATNEFTQNQIVSFFSVKHMMFSLHFMASTALMYLCVALLLLFLFYLFSKVKSILFLKKLYDNYKLVSLVIMLAIAFLILSEVTNIILVNLPLIFNSLIYIRFISWCPLFITFILFIYFYHHWFKKNNITKEDKIFYFMAIVGLLVSIRSYAYCFNGYLIFPLYIAFVYILLEKVPFLFKKMNVQMVKASFSASFVVFLLLFVVKYCFIYSNMNYLVQTKYGSFKTFEHVAVGFNLVIDFINTNIDKNAVITCYPEETMLNFLTRHYSTVMPTEYQFSGPDEAFLKRLGKSDYIIFSNYTYIKGTPTFLESLSSGDNGWYEWLTSHYTVISVLGDYGTKLEHPVKPYGALVFKKNK